MENDYITLEFEDVNVDVVCCINKEQQEEVFQVLNLDCKKANYGTNEFGSCVTVVQEKDANNIVVLFELMPNASTREVAYLFYDSVRKSVKEAMEACRQKIAMTDYTYASMCEDVFCFLYKKIINQHKKYRVQLNFERQWLADTNSFVVQKSGTIQ
jgi:hypothetical protein